MNSATSVRKLAVGALAVASFFVSGNVASAQVVTTGTTGSPDATTTVDSRYLPPPPPKFQAGDNYNL